MKFALLAPLAALCLAACSDSEPQGYTPVTFNLVTFVSSEQGKSHFAFQPANDDPIINLTADWTPPTAVKPGQRLLLSYVCSDPLASEAVTLKSATNCPGGVIKQVDKINPSPIPVRVITAWRSGSYINMRVAAKLNSNPVTIALQYTSATTSQLSLYLNQDNPLSPDAYQRETYLSFQCAPLWNLPTTSSLTINIPQSTPLIFTK